MYIKELFIVSFGCFNNRIFRFAEGINLLYGPNESGKTTLLDFIFFSFYGFKVKKNRDVTDFKSKYQTIENSSIGGSITFISQGLEYVLKRTYINKQSEIALFCITTGEEIRDLEILSSPGEYFFGIGSEAFLKTAYFSSLSARINADSSDEIVTKLRNLFESGNSEISYKEIADKINDEISEIESPRRKNSIIPSLENKIDAIKEEIYKHSSEEKNITDIEDNISKLNLKIEKINNEIDLYLEERNRISFEENSSSFELKLKFFLGFFSAFMIFSLFLYAKSVLAALLLTLLSLFGILIIWRIVSSKRKDSFDERKRKLFTLKSIDDKIDMLRINKAKAETDRAVLSEKIKSYIHYDENDFNKQLSNLENQREAYKKRVVALKLCLECLNKAYNEMKVLFSPQLCHNASEILSCISGGKYKKLIVNDSFVINVLTDNGYFNASKLSRGALEQAYISLRFALVELILSIKNTPLFLDDAFAYFDSQHLHNSAEYIKNISGNKQIFIATCRSEEYQCFNNVSNIINF